jgi:hypothetical protein
VRLLSRIGSPTCRLHTGKPWLSPSSRSLPRTTVHRVLLANTRRHASTWSLRSTLRASRPSHPGPEGPGSRAGQGSSGHLVRSQPGGAFGLNLPHDSGQRSRADARDRCGGSIASAWSMSRVVEVLPSEAGRLPASSPKAGKRQEAVPTVGCTRSDLRKRPLPTIREWRSCGQGVTCPMMSFAPACGKVHRGLRNAVADRRGSRPQVPDRSCAYLSRRAVASPVRLVITFGTDHPDVAPISRRGADALNH